MTDSTATRVWDLPVRIFHWALAASFAGAYLLAESERWRDIHVMFGYTVLGLIAFRVLWGLVGTRHARFRDFAYGPSAALRHLRDELAGRAKRHLGHNPAGSWAVYGLLLLGAATGVTGYLTFNEIGSESMESVHEACATAWLVLIVAHVAGVAFSSLMQRENLPAAMMTGLKRGPAEGLEPRPLTALGFLLALAVVGFWGWYIAPLQPITGRSAGATTNPGHYALAAEAESDDD